MSSLAWEAGILHLSTGCGDGRGHEAFAESSAGTHHRDRSATDFWCILQQEVAFTLTEYNKQARN